MATFAEALELEKAGKISEAYAILQEVAQSAPPSTQVQTHLASILLSWNRTQEALQRFVNATQIDPNNYYGWEGKARCLWALNQPQEALQAADQALRLKPDLPEALYMRGEALAKSDDENVLWQAVTCFDQVLRVNPAHIGAVTAKARTLLILGRWSDAYAAGQRSLQLDPDNAQGWRTVAVYHWERREFDPALTALERVIQQTPNDDTLWTLKGGILRNKYAFVRNRALLDQAIAAFDRALALNPGDSAAISARRETLAVQRETSALWSRTTITWIWLGGWVLFFVALFLALNGGAGATAGNIVGFISAALILIGWVMALVRSAQEGRWVFFTIILLFGNILGPLIVISFALRKFSDLSRS